jgi:hypothetical protein
MPEQNLQADQGMQDLEQKFASGELIAAEGHGPDYAKKQFGQKLEKLPEKYQNHLKRIVQKVAMRDQFARIEEVKRAAEQRFYWRNMMDVVWNEADSLWQQPYNGAVRDDSDTSDIPLTYPVNIFQSFGRGFISIVSEVPGVRFEAKGDTPDAQRIASSADAMRRKIEAQNDMDRFMEDVSRLFWTDGRVVFYSRWVTDGARFGYEDEEHPDEAEEGLEGPPDKKPRQPKGGEVCTPFGVLEAKVPINMREQADFPFLQISFEIDITSAKSLYPWTAKGLKGGQPGPGEYNFDRTTRIATTQGIKLLTQSGDTVEQLPTFQRTWLRPSMYAEIEDDNDRTFFEDAFPDGVFVAFVGDTYCESRNESMDDHLTVCHPMPGDGQATPSCGAIIIPIQDALNDMTDLSMETFMKGIPAIWCDKGIVDMQAISKQKAGPGAHYPSTSELDSGKKMSDGFWAEPIPQLGDSAMVFMNHLFTDIPQFLTGLYPSALGAPDEHNQTAKGIMVLAQQSKGQAGVAWRALRKCYAKAMMQLVRVGAYFRASETEDGMLTVTVPGQKEVTIDLEDLRDGNWWCFPDGDESYPNTHADRRQAYQALIVQSATNPVAAKILMEPKNLVLGKDLLGLQDLEVPGADSAEKQLSEIKQLLGEVPIPNMQAVAAYKVAVFQAQSQGQQPPPQPKPDQLMNPSVTIDVDFDDHQSEWETLKDWVNSSEGQDAKKSNPDGFLNVRLHGLLHKKELDQEQDAQQQQMLKMQAAAAQIKAASTPKKGPSESINFKDLGPSGKLQAAAQAGLDITADVASDLAGDSMGEGQGQPQTKQAQPTM